MAALLLRVISARLRRTLVLLLSLSLASCSHLIFQPFEQHLYSPEIFDVRYQDLWLDVEEGIRLHGWLLEPAGEKIGTVLYLHGNAENISTHFGAVYWLTQHGYEVTLYDYRGYGKSSGLAELDGVIRDVAAMRDHVMAQLSPDDLLIVMGHSLGGAFAIQTVAAADDKAGVDAVVSIAAFSDYRQITRDFLDTSWLTWALQWPLSLTIDNRYSPEDLVSQIAPVPLLLMHSRGDGVIGFEHAQRLYDAAQSPKQLIEIQGHHNGIFDPAENRRLLLDYLETLRRDRDSNQ